MCPRPLCVNTTNSELRQALIISEGVWVSENGQGWYGAPGVYNDDQGVAWKSITDAVHAKGGRIFAQLWHQGSVSHPIFSLTGASQSHPLRSIPSNSFMFRRNTHE